MLLNGGELDGVRILSARSVDLMWRNYIPQVRFCCSFRVSMDGEGCVCGRTHARMCCINVCPSPHLSDLTPHTHIHKHYAVHVPHAPERVGVGRPHRPGPRCVTHAHVTCHVSYTCARMPLVLIGYIDVYESPGPPNPTSPSTDPTTTHHHPQASPSGWTATSSPSPTGRRTAGTTASAPLAGAGGRRPTSTYVCVCVFVQFWWMDVNVYVIYLSPMPNPPILSLHTHLTYRSMWTKIPSSRTW